MAPTKETAIEDEQLFTVEGSTAVAATPITLAEAGLRERAHLQEWVVANPRILGDDILIVTFEFDRWQTASKSDGPRDRLDILGLDPSGALVVAELKRDRASSTVEMQALKYAAMVSRFTPDTLAGAHAQLLTRQTGETVTSDEAMVALGEHAGGELDPQLLRRPRVVLVAGDFSQTTTATCVWLSEMMADDNPITLIRYQAYRTEGGVVLTTSKLWPIPTVEDFTVVPRLVEATSVARSKQQRRRATSAVSRLVAADALEVGTHLALRATTEVDGDVREAVDRWVDADRQRGAATWTGSNPNALRWAVDGQDYPPTTLVRIILNRAAGLDRGVRGTSWWVNHDGDDLVILADELAPGSSASYTPRDWTGLHDLLEQLPVGGWTTYGDLADQVDSSAIAVGQHVTRCNDCVAAWRVLGSDGRPRDGFRWEDGRDESVRDLLEQEGVRFDDYGRADVDQRMDWSAA